MEQVWANDEAAGLTGIIGSQSVQQLVFNYVCFFQLSDTFFALCQIGQSNMVLKKETAYTYTIECKKKENMKQRFSCCGKSTGKGSKQNGKKLISN